MQFLYKLLTNFFYFIVPIYFFIRKKNKKEHHTRFKEKMAQINIPREKGFLVWFHVASVGEAMSILPIVENISIEKKVDKILITSITLSSAEILQKKFYKSKKVVHQFLPLDIPRYIEKFLNHWSPNLAIFVESEIWPNIIFKIKKKNIPLLLLNARITEKTFYRWRIFKNYAKKIFENFDLCLASNKETENFLITLGAKNIKNFGNLKFTKIQKSLNNPLNSNFLSSIKNRKIWCASSTHHNEEAFCAKVHLDIKKRYENILTIIIPRHINRVTSINKTLAKLNLKVVLYSKCDQLNYDTDILLVDTYGDTAKFFNITDNIFLGGSIVKHGGQNPIEASRLGCKVFHGPNVKNFFEIYNYLKSLGVTDEINNVPELTQSLIHLLSLSRDRNTEIVSKIENYGLDILNNTMREIKIYINN